MSSDQIAIRINNLNKCYQIYDKPEDRLKQSIVPRFQSLFRLRSRQYFHDFWALRDISFEINKGETVGIIGRNGCGKSTLLQIICGTLTPSSGTVETFGRIAALLELGAGFNPEFTGRENVYMSGAILGLRQDEIEERFDDIASFADIGQFIEQPVKTYSSGMFVRLAFAVNIMSQPEIMIVDEALAVGDMNFQARCMTALTRIQESGATVLFVSHDVGAVKSLCSRGIYLEQGVIKEIGKASDVAELYVRTMREEMNEHNQVASGVAATPLVSSLVKPDFKKSNESFKFSEEFDLRVAQFRYGLGRARIAFVEFLDMNDHPLVSVEFDQQVKIKIYFTVEDKMQLSANYYIQDDKKNLILGAGLRTVGEPLLSCQSGDRYIVTYITKLPLHEGNYSIQFQLSKPVIPDQIAEFLDVIDDAIVFNVQRKKIGRIWTKVYIPNSVEVTTA